jgi:hypothetical protein
MVLLGLILLLSPSRLLLDRVLVAGLGGMLADALSDIEDVKGTDPVRRTTIIPRVKRVMPNERAKYSSRTI